MVPNSVDSMSSGLFTKTKKPRPRPGFIVRAKMVTSRLMRFLELKLREIPIVQGYLFLIRKSPESF